MNSQSKNLIGGGDGVGIFMSIIATAVIIWFIIQSTRGCSAFKGGPFL